MKVTCQLEDYSNPPRPSIKVHNAWNDGEKVELEVSGIRYTVIGEELISAVKRAMLNCFGR